MIARPNMIDEVEEAILRGTAERRADLLWRITDLFVIGASHYSDDHVALFDDVIGRLAAEIEVVARVALANRLATITNAPPHVIRRLAFDDAIDVAGPVLTYSTRIDDAALIDNAKAKGQQHLLAISRRALLIPAVTDILVERGDQAVVQSTAENNGAQFSDFGYTTLVKRAEGDDQLALTVGSRLEIPRHYFLKVLAKASQVVRDRLKETNPQAIGDIKGVVSEVAERIQARAGADSRDYVSAVTAVEALKRSGQLGESAVEAFARAGHFEETTAALAALCDLPIGAVETAMVQERSELVLILAKSIGLSWRTAKAILQLRSGTTGMSAQDLEQQLKGYELLKAATAQQVVRFQRTRGQGKAPRVA
jgi:uncharacterized protein (DUF2336 family)